jgi:hypothetical protein
MMRKQRVLAARIAFGVSVCMSISPVTADRAHDLAKQASKQQVKTCDSVGALDLWHSDYPTGCSGSQKPRYDAYLNFLKDQDPGPSSVPIATLTEHDWVRKEAQLSDLDVTKANHADRATALADLGEGNIYAVVGYMYYRVTNHGETSNCQLTGSDNNDFHIGVGFDLAVAAQLLQGSQVPDAQATRRHRRNDSAVSSATPPEVDPGDRRHPHRARSQGCWTVNRR